jgi:hypothetical protein
VRPQLACVRLCCCWRVCIVRSFSSAPLVGPEAVGRRWHCLVRMCEASVALWRHELCGSINTPITLPGCVGRTSRACDARAMPATGAASMAIWDGCQDTLKSPCGTGAVTACMLCVEVRCIVLRARWPCLRAGCAQGCSDAPAAPHCCLRVERPSQASTTACWLHCACMLVPHICQCHA